MLKKLSIALSALVIAVGMFVTTPSSATAKTYFSIGFGNSYGWGGRSGYSRWGYNSYFTPSYAYYPWGRYSNWNRGYGIRFGYAWLKGKGKKGRKGRYLPTRMKKRRLSGRTARKVCFRNKKCRAAFYRYTRKQGKRRAR